MSSPMGTRSIRVGTVGNEYGYKGTHHVLRPRTVLITPVSTLVISCVLGAWVPKEG
jgi:hypothetical protein